MMHWILCVFVLIDWIEIDGDIALIKPIPFLRGKSGQDQREDFKENRRMIAKKVLVLSPLLY